MQISKIFVALIASAGLAACGGGGGPGGGGGGVVSTPAPTPTPTPTPVANTDVGNLVTSERFSSLASSHQVTFDLPSGEAKGSSTAQVQTSITYDAGADSYTIDLGGRAVFTASDIVNQSEDAVVYRSTDGDETLYLTLINQQPRTDAPRGSVGMGLFQRNVFPQGGQGVQESDILYFVYGFETLGDAMPRTGQLRYTTSMIGLRTSRSQNPLSYFGEGEFLVDLATGYFTASSEAERYDLVKEEELVGTATWSAAGQLSSVSSSFSGFFTFAGLTGELDGSFFGEDAGELGLTFSGTDELGSSVSGAMIGQRDGPSMVNQTLVALLEEETFLAPAQGLFAGALANGVPHRGTTGSPLSLTIDLEGNIYYDDTWSWFTPMNFDASSSEVTQDGSIIRYIERDRGGNAVLFLNNAVSPSGVALSYMNFGSMRMQDEFNGGLYEIRRAFIYGFKTPDFLLRARTGTASYSGIVYGTANTESASRYFTASGTSSFVIDFKSGNVDGSFDVIIVDDASGERFFLGQYTVDTALRDTRNQFYGSVDSGGSSVGAFDGYLFGPIGQELGGSFQLTAPDVVDDEDVWVQGIVAATEDR
ncbi:transferrin-binding protein-like solute binding protein [Paraurantiacibacter namhicola]|uniref:Transferrin-binding protein B C-lobe/N-lobe beta-barrel domain-containing protein n=1 Tax=Paraurantiacibacter namhicola TaxID=645517 RepID=A0A1C7D7X1_9SPHN|nr:transferrin-binding protein-like solute binding protein [Paraurantiacibacter namhicola]ANU07580.1 hypothetical protein A6F65_01274 [Paraurantiacibacter namhicola]